MTCLVCLRLVVLLIVLVLNFLMGVLIACFAGYLWLVCGVRWISLLSAICRRLGVAVGVLIVLGVWFGLFILLICSCFGIFV